MFTSINALNATYKATHELFPISVDSNKILNIDCTCWQNPV